MVNTFSGIHVFIIVNFIVLLKTVVRFYTTLTLKAILEWIKSIVALSTERFSIKKTAGLSCHDIASDILCSPARPRCSSL